MDSLALSKEVATYFSMGFGFGTSIIFAIVGVRMFYELSR